MHLLGSGTVKFCIKLVLNDSTASDSKINVGIICLYGNMLLTVYSAHHSASQSNMN